MKRIVLFVCLAAVLGMSGLLPFSGHDVAELVPVETLLVDWNGKQVALNGGRCRGYGEDWETALQDLQEGADGTVFLGTAEQVVLSQSAVKLLPDVIRSEQLRPAAVICICAGPLPEVDALTGYLSSKDAGVTIGDVQAAMVAEKGIALPVIRETEGGLRLYGPENR